MIDYKAHNQEVRAVWDAFHKGTPIRVPVIAGVSSRWAVLDRRVNARGVDFREYTENPRLMFEMQAEFDRFRRMNVPGDHEMGLPQEGWSVDVDFENYYEAGWLGAQVCFLPGNVPYAMPLLGDDNKRMLFDRGIPGAFDGLMGTHREYFERFTEYAKDYRLDGVPVGKIQSCGEWMDGPMTIACELRGAENFCLDLYEDPDYADELLDYLTEATIQRVRAWRGYLGKPLRPKSFGFADDSVQLLSLAMYKERVLPRHKRLMQALSTCEERGGVHMCGDATRMFETIRNELNCYTFDTGFPVDHADLARRLGPEVTIQGGPPSALVEMGTPAQIMDESLRILNAVAPYTKKFVLRDGNDIPPNAPIENIQAMLDASRRFAGM